MIAEHSSDRRRVPTDLVRRMVDVRERRELLERLVRVRERLGGGLDPLSIQDWQALSSELPRLTDVVRRARENLALDRRQTADLVAEWRRLVLLLETEVFAHLPAHVSPGLTMEYRIHEQIRAVTTPLAALKGDPAL